MRGNPEAFGSGRWPTKEAGRDYYSIRGGKYNRLLDYQTHDLFHADIAKGSRVELQRRPAKERVETAKLVAIVINITPSVTVTVFFCKKSRMRLCRILIVTDSFRYFFPPNRLEKKLPMEVKKLLTPVAKFCRPCCTCEAFFTVSVRERSFSLSSFTSSFSSERQSFKS